MAAHQAPPSLGFSRQEHWSGLPFPSPMRESEKWKVKVKSLSHVRLLATPWTACSLPGSSVHWILQARIPEWLALPSSRGSSRPMDQTCVSCISGWFFTIEPPGKPTHTYISFLLDFLPIQVTTEHWVSSLYYTVGALQLSILYIISIVYMCQSQSPYSFHIPLFSLSIHMFVLYIYVSISALQVRSSIPFL